MYKVLVCGGRSYADAGRVFTELYKLHKQQPIDLLIHGGARGADGHAESWAAKECIPFLRHPANWHPEGRSTMDKSAGPKRNRAMMKWRPDLVLAFPGGNGTADMIEVAQKAGVQVMVIE